MKQKHLSLHINIYFIIDIIETLLLCKKFIQTYGTGKNHSIHYVTKL